MLRAIRRSTCIAALLSAFALSGCAVVDHYSMRAVDYNKEAEQAQESVLLLNIIRASLRRPMQFTSLSSITGNANVSGSLQGGGVSTQQVPFLSQFPSVFSPNPPVGTNTNSAITRINTGNVTGNVAMSGGATFTVPVLDTQEFYQGILTPIPLQAFDYYLQQGFPPELLFDLFVNKIEVIRLDDGTCRKFTFQNSVRNELQFGQFQAFIDYLIGSGLSAERINSVTPYGPPIPQPSAAPTSAAETAQILDAYSKVSAAGLDIRQEGRGENARYRVQKRNSVFRFCFAHPTGMPADWIGQPTSSMFCGQFNRRLQARVTESQSDGGGECTPRRLIPRAPKTEDGAEGERENMDSRSQGLPDGGVSEFRGIRLAPQFLNRIDLFQREMTANRPNTPPELLFPSAAFANGMVSFKVYTRSTEGILYYLGEVIRKHLFTEFGDPSRVTQVKTSIRHGTLPLSECDDRANGGSWQSKTDLVYLSRRRAGASGAPGSYYCENLFVLETEFTGDTVITVTYDGKVFGIPRDSNRGGRTLQVLELVKQLLALNTSARQLPSTSVISVIGGQ
jgi:hypothetical protein